MIFERAISFKLMPIVDVGRTTWIHESRHESFANGRQTDVFYGDFRNAFDTLWQPRLIEKLATFYIGTKTAKCKMALCIRGGTNECR